MYSLLATACTFGHRNESGSLHISVEVVERGRRIKDRRDVVLADIASNQKSDG